MLWVIGGVVALVAVIAFAMRKGGALSLPSQFPPGTRAFEAELTLKPLQATIAQRREELAATTDEARRAKLERQIAFLSAQVVALEKIVAARDLSPGKGYIGFEAPPED
jgi:hypothetical protein